MNCSHKIIGRICCSLEDGSRDENRQKRKKRRSESRGKHLRNERPREMILIFWYAWMALNPSVHYEKALDE